MGKGCREGSHLQIVLKTGKNPEKKTKNNEKKNPIVWGKEAGKVFICRLFHSADCFKTGKNPEKKTINNQKKNK